MCRACYEEAGSPVVDNAAVRRAAKLIGDLYEVAPTGGRAHIVVDDWNLESTHVEYCLAQIDHGASLDDSASLAARDCLLALQSLSVEERATALAMHEGWIP